MKNKKISILRGSIILLVITGLAYWYIDNSKSEIPELLSPENIQSSKNKDESDKTLEDTLKELKTKQVGGITDWQDCENKEAGFKITCPKLSKGFETEYLNGEWIFTTGKNGSLFGTLLSTSGGMIWGVNRVNHNEMSLEDLIRSVGSQFKEKRNEKREDIVINGKKALLVTVTVSNNKDWVQKSVYIEDGEFIYAIGNGAIDFSEFEIFYNSFKLL